MKSDEPLNKGDRVQTTVKAYLKPKKKTGKKIDSDETIVQIIGGTVEVPVCGQVIYEENLTEYPKIKVHFKIIKSTNQNLIGKYKDKYKEDVEKGCNIPE